MQTRSNILSPVNSQLPQVIVVETNLGVFGNRTDVIVVDGTTTQGPSLLQCDNPAVYHSDNLQLSRSDNLMTYLSRPNPPEDGPLDDGTEQL